MHVQATRGEEEKKGNLAVSSKDVAPADVRVTAWDPLKKSFLFFELFSSRDSLKQLLILFYVFFVGPPTLL